MGRKKTPLAMAIGALGVVFGDIGTSPLYAVNGIFSGHPNLAREPGNVLGTISLLLWMLAIVITGKYILLVLRADNDGEGGVFALYALLHRQRRRRAIFGLQGLLLLLLVAAGLLFGAGIITPAISVLSAVEGLQVAFPAFEPYVVGLTVLILAGLFLMQSKGTERVGAAFGPLLAAWFLAIAILGGREILQVPSVLQALNPLLALRFLFESPVRSSLIALGGVMLSFTGGEAMYADLGHFGLAPIRRAWVFLVFPALVLNYLGQGAYLLSGKPLAGGSLFFSMAPPALLIPLVLLSTAATVVASQALITGAFSLASQAVALGLFPRLNVVHTHEEHEGQVYLPFVNWTLFLLSSSFVWYFGSSTALAAAYGLAESGVMLGTSIAMTAVARLVWGWSVARVIAVFAGFLLADTSFLVSNSLRFHEGGYIPLIIGLAMFAVMATWRWGRKATYAAYSGVKTMTLRELVELKESCTSFLERNAVLMIPRPLHSLDENTPALLQLLWSRHGLLPRDLLFVEVSHRKVPFVHGERCEVRVFQKQEGRGSIMSVTVNFGFMENADVEAALEALARHQEINLDPAPAKWIVHVTSEHLLPARKLKPWGKLRFRLFALLRQVSIPGYFYYGLGKKVQLSVEIVPVHLG